MGCGIMYEIYTIKSGDNINNILDMYNTSMEELVKLNGVIDLSNLKEGMQIIVPVSNNPYKYYTVKKGDTLSKIADSYNIDVSLLTVINGLDANDYIYPTHTLIIPKEHTLDVETIDKNTLSHILECSIKVKDILKEKLNIDGYTLLQNNGIAQEVKHFHLHVIPKYEKEQEIISVEEIYNKIK